MKYGEFITESITDIPPDVMARLSKLLIKSLQYLTSYLVAHPTFYALIDMFDEIYDNRIYARSPRRSQAIELLFPYVVQNLDEIIKATKPEGYEFPFPIIIKLFKRNVDNDAVAEVVNNNKDRLLAILNALVHTTLKSEYNVDRARKEHLILEICRTLKNNFIDWPELDKLTTHFISQRYNSMLDKDLSEIWDIHNVTNNVIRDMINNRVTLNDLDPALVKRMQGLKSTLLNKHFLNFKWDSIRYSIESIKTWYNMLKQVGFTWPELTNFEHMTLDQQLKRLKFPIIQELFKFFENNNEKVVIKVIAELRKLGVDWPDLSIIERSLGKTTPIAESDRHRALAHDVKVVKQKLSKGDYADAIRYMGEYGLTYADATAELQDAIKSRKYLIVRELLDIANNNTDIYRLHRLMSFVKHAELGWREIDLIFNSVEAAYENEYGKI